LWSENAHEINAGDARKASMEAGVTRSLGDEGRGGSAQVKPVPASLNGPVARGSSTIVNKIY
jgi:hypothetical protein